MSTQIRTPQEVKQLGNILGVWAHPDDESWCAAGLLAAARANSQRVVCLMATKGEAGVQDTSRWPAAKLADIRARELAAGLECLAIDDYHWLGCRDGDCDDLSDKAGAAKIKAHIKTHLPDTLVTFGPEGLTGHEDHQAVSRWVQLAAQGTDLPVYHVVVEKALYEKYLKQLDAQFNLYFKIDRPPLKSAADCAIALRLTPDLLQKKWAALKAMPSQTEAVFQHSPEGYLEAALGQECFILAKSGVS